MFIFYFLRVLKISSLDFFEIFLRGFKLFLIYFFGSFFWVFSEVSFDELYYILVKLLFRKYVDKILKWMGMNKMLLRFKEFLDRML